MESSSQVASSSSASGTGSRGGGRKRKSTATHHVEVEVQVAVAAENVEQGEPADLDARPAVDLRMSLGPHKKSPQNAESSGQAQNPAARAPAGPRHCLECGATGAPLWRKGPRGTRTLCNACGLRYWIEENFLCTKLKL